MDARYVQRGDAIDHTPVADVAAGDLIVLAEKLVGVAKLDIKAGELGALALTGVYETTKASGVVFAKGAEVGLNRFLFETDFIRPIVGGFELFQRREGLARFGKTFDMSVKRREEEERFGVLRVLFENGFQRAFGFEPFAAQVMGLRFEEQFAFGVVKERFFVTFKPSAGDRAEKNPSDDKDDAGRGAEVAAEKIAPKKVDEKGRLGENAEKEGQRELIPKPASNDADEPGPKRKGRKNDAQRNAP